MMQLINLLVSVVMYPVCFVVEFWRAFKTSCYYHSKAGYILGERKGLTGKEFDKSDVASLAQQLQMEDEQLAAHRARFQQ